MRAIVEKASSAAPLEPLLVAHFNDEKRIAAIMEAPIVRIAEFPSLCIQLSEYAFRRRVSTKLMDLREAVVNPKTAIGEAIANIEDSSIKFTQTLHNRSQKWVGRNGELISMREYLDTPDPLVLKTDLCDLDAILKFAPGTLNIIAGRPSMGKSAIGLFIADKYAQGQNKATLFVSLEMESRDLQARRISIHSGIPHMNILARRLSAEEREKVLYWESFINKAPLHYDTNPESSLATIKASIRKVIQREGNISAFFVDYLQLLSRDERNKANELDEISKGLRILAREFNIPCIALAQLNRGVESQTNKRPLMSDIRSSGAIEQHADTVSLIYRDEYYNDKSPDRGITELIVGKNRNGPTGTVKLLHKLQFNNYYNLGYR